jgi:hypothetical protein
MPDGYVRNFGLEVSDHRSRNGSKEAKSPRADQLRKLYPAISKNALSPGFNVSIEGSLFDGSA